MKEKKMQKRVTKVWGWEEQKKTREDEEDEHSQMFFSLPSRT
jgi:hypothetical protein